MNPPPEPTSLGVTLQILKYGKPVREGVIGEIMIKSVAKTMG